MGNDWGRLIEDMANGSERALARLITLVENRGNGWLDAMKRIYPKTGKALVVGVTGAPGAGKSTLTDGLTARLVKKGLRVGIIAVDPSSPFSGGALLGDRLRMLEISVVDGVFVRSMATRGALGGLSLAARDVVKLMDAFGKEVIIVETVGVGQDEVEIVKTADTVLVVCIPGMGDGIQAIKAGIMEIADVFVVNKCDREGAAQAAADIRAMLELCAETSMPAIPIFKTSATTGVGMDLLSDHLYQNFKKRDNRDFRHENRVRSEILGLLEKEIARHLRLRIEHDGWLDNAVDQVVRRERDPYSVVGEIMAPFIEVMTGYDGIMQHNPPSTKVRL